MTTTTQRSKGAQDTEIVVVWNDSIDPNGSSPIWATIRYPDAIPAMTDQRDVIVVEVSAHTQRSAISNQPSGVRRLAPRRS
jgi:hypothetical protein